MPHWHIYILDLANRIYGLTMVYTRLLSEVASVGLELRVAGKDDGVKVYFNLGEIELFMWLLKSCFAIWS